MRDARGFDIPRVSECSQIRGAKANAIDELPLEWFYGDGEVLDTTSKPDGKKVDVVNLNAALGTVG